MAQTQYIVGGGISTGNVTLNTSVDSTQVRINSRSYTQASGDSMAFQAKPSQTVTTTGTVKGGDISPRLQAAVGAGNLIGLHVDTDMKGSTGGNVTAIYGLEVEVVSDASSGRTISGNVSAIKVRSNLDATVSGIVAVLEVPAGEVAGGQWDALANIAAVAGVFDSADTNTAGTKRGYLKFRVNGTDRFVRLYDSGV